MNDQVYDEAPVAYGGFDLGRRRPDGKFNIWRKVDLPAPMFRQWVIVFVAPSYNAAVRWMRRKSRVAS